jgi:hypothetical protein
MPLKVRGYGEGDELWAGLSAICCLPFEQPVMFEFVVNRKTAQALGITFPNEIMLQVTEVIE